MGLEETSQPCRSPVPLRRMHFLGREGHSLLCLGLTFNCVFFDKLDLVGGSPQQTKCQATKTTTKCKQKYDKHLA